MGHYLHCCSLDLLFVNFTSILSNKIYTQLVMQDVVVCVESQFLYLSFNPHTIGDLSHDMRFPTMWYVRPAKPQISLPIEPLVVA